LKSTKATDS